MMKPRFLQATFLASYPAALLNRDDSGLAKRIPFGGATRTRISSQCQKRHWRVAEDPHALHVIDGADAAYRSREVVTKMVFGDIDPESNLAELEPLFQQSVYGDKGTSRKSRQTLLLGEREIDWLRDEVPRFYDANVEKIEEMIRLKGSENKKEQKEGADIEKPLVKDLRDKFSAMRDMTALPGGLIGALFGRMVTSDPAANITAPVHVAHAFTVHAEEAESDYFVAIDDLQDEGEVGTDTIQETEITSGLYMGYVVVDIPGLMANLGPTASDLAGAVLHNLVYLMAEVSPGAKLGSTAPYSRAAFMLLEAGDRQPRSLAEAFRIPCSPDTGEAIKRLCTHLGDLDAAYATGEERRFMSLKDVSIPGAERGSIKDLAEWASSLPGQI